MKPHEETWYEASGDVFVQVGATRSDADHLVMYGDHRGPRKRLIAAAPEMARAMLGSSGKGHHVYSPNNDAYSCHWCAHVAPAHSPGCEIGRILTNAGVLP